MENLNNSAMLPMTEAIVYTESERKLFAIDFDSMKLLSRNKSNRLIKRQHVKELSDSMIGGSKMPPIVVNRKTNNIIDGQHRVVAAIRCIEKGLLPKDYKLDVMFSDIPEEDELPEIINCNIHSQSWQLGDYINAFIKNGNVNYKILVDWCEKHPMMHTSSSVKKKTGYNSYKYRAAAAIIKQKTCQKELVSQTLIITDKDLENSEAIYEEIRQILEVIRSPRPAALEQAVAEWCKVRNKYPFKNWIYMLKHRSSIRNMKAENQKDFKDIYAALLSELAQKDNLK